MSSDTPESPIIKCSPETHMYVDSVYPQLQRGHELVGWGSDMYSSFPTTVCQKTTSFIIQLLTLFSFKDHADCNNDTKKTHLTNLLIF